MDVDSSERSCLVNLAEELIEMIVIHLDFASICALRLTSRRIENKASHASYRRFFVSKRLRLASRYVQDFVRVTQPGRPGCSLQHLTVIGLVPNWEKLSRDGGDDNVLSTLAADALSIHLSPTRRNKAHTDEVGLVSDCGKDDADADDTLSTYEIEDAVVYVGDEMEDDLYGVSDDGSDAWESDEAEGEQSESIEDERSEEDHASEGEVEEETTAAAAISGGEEAGEGSEETEELEDDDDENEGEEEEEEDVDDDGHGSDTRTLISDPAQQSNTERDEGWDPAVPTELSVSDAGSGREDSPEADEESEFWYPNFAQDRRATTSSYNERVVFLLTSAFANLRHNGRPGHLRSLNLVLAWMNDDLHFTRRPYRWRHVAPTMQVSDDTARMIARAVTTSQIKIVKLDFYHTIPRCAIGATWTREGQIFLPAMRSLKSLSAVVARSIAPRDRDYYAQPGESNWSWDIRAFLKPFSDLEKLELRWLDHNCPDRQPSEPRRSFDSVAQLTFPHLVNLSLKGVSTDTEASLLSFLAKHRRLHGLTLCHIILDHGAWRPVFEFIRRKLNLRFLAFETLREEWHAIEFIHRHKDAEWDYHRSNVLCCRGEQTKHRIMYESVARSHSLSEKEKDLYGPF